jgi:hypothetical protein
MGDCASSSGNTRNTSLQKRGDVNEIEFRGRS